MITITTKQGYKLDVVRNVRKGYNPRQFTECGLKIICFGDTRLSDKHLYRDMEDFIEDLLDRCDEVYEDTDSMSFEEKIEYLKDFYAMIPLYNFMSKDGINIIDNVRPSGMIYAKVHYDNDEEMFGPKRRKYIKQMKACLKSEFTSYKHYLNGDCYDLSIRDSEDNIVNFERAFFGALQDVYNYFHEFIGEYEPLDLCEFNEAFLDYVYEPDSDFE